MQLGDVATWVGAAAAVVAAIWAMWSARGARTHRDTAAAAAAEAVQAAQESAAALTRLTSLLERRDTPWDLRETGKAQWLLINASTAVLRDIDLSVVEPLKLLTRTHFDEMHPGASAGVTVSFPWGPVGDLTVTWTAPDGTKAVWRSPLH